MCKAGAVQGTILYSVLYVLGPVPMLQVQLFRLRVIGRVTNKLEIAGTAHKRRYIYMYIYTPR